MLEFNEQEFRELSRYRRYEYLRKLRKVSRFRYYVLERQLEYLLFIKWKCPVCGKYMRKDCIKEC